LRLFEEVQRSWYGLDRIVSAAEPARISPGRTVCRLPAGVFPVVFAAAAAALSGALSRGQPADCAAGVPLLEEWLSAQRHDLGLTETLHTPAGTERTPLLTLNEVCVLPQSHPLASKPVLTPADFHGENYISLSRTDSYRQLLDALFLSIR
jgi:DNA-binding transcriptional LysR family regulator